MEGKEKRGRNKIIVQKLLHLSPVRKKISNTSFICLSHPVYIAALRDYIYARGSPSKRFGDTVYKRKEQHPNLPLPRVSPETQRGEILRVVFPSDQLGASSRGQYRVISRAFRDFRRDVLACEKYAGRSCARATTLGGGRE